MTAEAKKMTVAPLKPRPIVSISHLERYINKQTRNAVTTKGKAGTTV